MDQRHIENTWWLLGFANISDLLRVDVLNGRAG